MSQRVNIAIPDDLHKRLEAVKENLNVSAICQSAIEAAVSLEEIKMSAMSKRDAAIARLKVEAEQEHNDWYQSGKKSGLEDAPDLSYADFAVITRCRDAGVIIAQEDGFDWLNDVLEQEECPDSESQHFMNGWVDGVVEFWDSIKSEVA